MPTYGIMCLTDSPEVEVISLAQAKAHLRVDHDADDDLIVDLVHAAVDEAERYCNAAFFPKSFELTLPGWPASGVIYIPKHPLIAVGSISYRDSDGDVQTLDASAYVVSTDTLPPMISRAYGETWPQARCHPAAVTVAFTAGYVTVPPAALIGIKLLLGHLYENRETVVVGGQAVELPLGAQHWLSRCVMHSLT